MFIPYGVVNILVHSPMCLYVAKYSMLKLLYLFIYAL